MTEDATVPEQRTASADEQDLLLRLRAGEDSAFSELFESHAAAVRRLARGLASDSSEAEDITAETFFRVLQALRRGSGPKDHVRAYLLTVARRVSWEWHGARRDVPVTDDELTHRAGAGADAHARTAEHSLIATAFVSLPERWRSVLWQTEVEGEQPAVVAPHFGLSANATAALARRARQGLRAAYLQAHLAMNRTSDVSCRGVIEKLGGYTAGSVTGSEAARIRTHLLGCASCRSMYAELREVCSSLRAHAGVLAMLVPATATAAGSGVLTTIKGLVLSKLKIGIALASTAAAGVVGIAVGPAMMDTDHSQAISLPQGGVELQISTPQPSLLSSPPGKPVPPDEATLHLPGRAGADQNPQRDPVVGPPATGTPAAPAGTSAPAAQHTTVPQSPPSSQGPRSSQGGSPRDDTGQGGTTFSSTSTKSKPDKGNHGSKNHSRSDMTPDKANQTTTITVLFWWLSPRTDSTTSQSTTGSPGTTESDVSGSSG